MRVAPLLCRTVTSVYIIHHCHLPEMHGHYLVIFNFNKSSKEKKDIHGKWSLNFFSLGRLSLRIHVAFQQHQNQAGVEMKINWVQNWILHITLHQKNYYTILQRIECNFSFLFTFLRRKHRRYLRINIIQDAFCVRFTLLFHAYYAQLHRLQQNRIVPLHHPYLIHLK